MFSEVVNEEVEESTYSHLQETNNAEEDNDDVYNSLDNR